MHKSLSLPVADPSQVGEVRRAAQKLAAQAGFGSEGASDVGIVATELASNLHKHAKQGEIVLRILPPRPGAPHGGLEFLSLDRGPGIPDVRRCLEDGFSTSGTQGQGLGAIRRLSAVFDLHSTPLGTALLAQLLPKASDPAPSDGPRLEVGAVCLPHPGEVLCGDAWAAAPRALVVADGLGHGKEACDAADLAVEVFGEAQEAAPQLHLQRAHAALRATRGAAVLALAFSPRERKVACAGIGNVAACLLQGEVSRSFVSLNGTVGHQAQRFQEFLYDWPAGATVVVHTDGLQTRWKLDAYPGIQARHPSLLAGILYRDFRRGRDDVTVVVVRETVSPQ